MNGRMTRRGLLKGGLAATALVGLGSSFGRLSTASAASFSSHGGPYGPLGPPNADGLRIPAGFSARPIAITGQPIANTNYVWHTAPDGAGTFPLQDGGWIFAQNSEGFGTAGGASAIKFDAAGEPVSAYRILGGTKWNCQGGVTPWGTWLSCEEGRAGQVWECDPFRPGQGVVRPGLGTFQHETSPVDPETGYVYITEDQYDARIYRFRPTRFGDLSAGTLEAAAVSGTGRVTWIQVGIDRPARGKNTTGFERPEGAAIEGGVFYFVTSTDERVWALDLATDQLTTIYDGVADAAADLHNPDNLTVHAPTGHLYVAEDGDDLQLVLLESTSGGWVTSPFVQLVGHSRSEVTGPVFTPDGQRLYVTSQRGTDNKTGVTYEITGPFAQ